MSDTATKQPSRTAQQPRALTASGRWERIWHEAGDPPKPPVSTIGTPDQVAARQFAAWVARGRFSHR
jgi:hypothetical protein